MATPNVTVNNSFEEWRVITNDIATDVGDLDLLDSLFVAGDVVGAVNELKVASPADFAIAMAIALG